MLTAAGNGDKRGGKEESADNAGELREKGKPAAAGG